MKGIWLILSATYVSRVPTGRKEYLYILNPHFFFRSYLLDDNVIHADVKRPRKSRFFSIGHVVLI